MSTDLTARLRAVIEERRAVARAAPPGPWSTSGPDTIGEWIVYDQHWSVAEATAYVGETTILPDLPRPEAYIDANATAAHIALNDPADAILAAEHALGVIERHAEGDYGQCIGCGDPYGGGFLSWPCDEIRSLARRYGLAVDGG